MVRNPRHFGTKTVERKTEKYIEAGVDRGLPMVKVGTRTTITEELSQRDKAEKERLRQKLKRALQ